MCFICRIQLQLTSELYKYKKVWQYSYYKYTQRYKLFSTFTQSLIPLGRIMGYILDGSSSFSLCWLHSFLIHIFWLPFIFLFRSVFRPLWPWPRYIPLFSLNGSAFHLVLQVLTCRMYQRSWGSRKFSWCFQWWPLCTLDWPNPVGLVFGGSEYDPGYEDGATLLLTYNRIKKTHVFSLD